MRGRLAMAGVPDRKPTAEVVSIGSRRGYKPDYKGLASTYIRKARQKLDLDREAFAAHMSNSLDGGSRQRSKSDGSRGRTSH